MYRRGLFCVDLLCHEREWYDVALTRIVFFCLNTEAELSLWKAGPKMHWERLFFVNIPRTCETILLNCACAQQFWWKTNVANNWHLCLFINISHNINWCGEKRNEPAAFGAVLCSFGAHLVFVDNFATQNMYWSTVSCVEFSMPFDTCHPPLRCVTFDGCVGGHPISISLKCWVDLLCCWVTGKAPQHFKSLVNPWSTKNKLFMLVTSNFQMLGDRSPSCHPK